MSPVGTRRGPRAETRRDERAHGARDRRHTRDRAGDRTRARGRGVEPRAWRHAARVGRRGPFSTNCVRADRTSTTLRPIFRSATTAAVSSRKPDVTAVARCTRWSTTPAARRGSEPTSSTRQKRASTSDAHQPAGTVLPDAGASRATSRTPACGSRLSRQHRLHHVGVGRDGVDQPRRVLREQGRVVDGSEAVRRAFGAARVSRSTRSGQA